jgi:methionyl aminopeptidase
MIVEGSFETYTEPNGWTVKTKDKKLSAHWEHTVAMTTKGLEILTIRKDETYELHQNGA